MRRILEKEIMDDKEGALAYAKADMSKSNQFFVDKLLQKYSKNLNNVLDIGCGPADIPVRLVKAKPDVNITAVDASDKMIELAKNNVNKEKYESQIKLMRAYLPGLPFLPHSFDTVISNSLLHHLPDPMLFWKEIKLLGKKGSIIFVMDLFRPDSPEKAKEIVEREAPSAPKVHKEDFYNSLLASFKLKEIKEQLSSANLPNVSAEIVSDLHWLAAGTIG